MGRTLARLFVMVLVGGAVLGMLAPEISARRGRGHGHSRVSGPPHRAAYRPAVHHRQRYRPPALRGGYHRAYRRAYSYGPRYYPRPLVAPVFVGPPVYYAPPAPPVVVVRPAGRWVPVEPAPAPAPRVHVEEHHYYDVGPPMDDAPESGYEQPEAVPGPPPAAESEAPVAPLSDDELYRIEERLLQLTDQARREAGLESVVHQEHMGLAAVQHSGEMYTMDYFSHTSPVAQHRSFTDRLEAAGVTGVGAASENIAMTRYSAQVADELFKMWMESPAHRANLLRPEFRYTGIGVYGDGEMVYATQVFASKVELSPDAPSSL